ncbi:hypothetical protein LTR95_018450 [Oleoguttula sp. CCFEE 5521]
MVIHSLCVCRRAGPGDDVLGNCRRHLLNLPRELRNQIYDSVLALEGITIINGRTGLHPLGRTCRQLNTELTSRTNGRATDAAIALNAKIFDFDFSHIATWLDTRAPLPGEVRQLAFDIVVLPSTSDIGLPYDNEDGVDISRSLLPLFYRRLVKLCRNIVRTWVIGKWEASERDTSSVILKHEATPGMHTRSSFFRLQDQQNGAKYVGTLAVYMQETTRYSPSWPKPRNDSVKRFVAKSLRSSHAATHDYAHRIKHMLPVLAKRKLSICHLLDKAMHEYMRSFEYNRLSQSLSGFQHHRTGHPSMRPGWRKADEQSYQTFEANAMRIVMWRGVVDGHEARQRRALKQAAYSLGCKREAEDDQHAPRKARCLMVMDHAERRIAYDLVEAVDGTSGWDMERMVESLESLAFE